MTAIFIGLITFVAGLNILVVLSMTVSDEARTLRAAFNGDAARTDPEDILYQGIAIGATGTVSGLAVGYAFVDRGKHIN